MILFLEAVDKWGELRSFSLFPDQLETGFDFVNFIIAKGDTLICLELIDNAKRIKLPIEAFDGLPISKSVNQLKFEWQQILSEPVETILRHRKWMIDNLEQRIEINQSQLNHYQELIRQLEIGLFTAQEIRCDESKRVKILHRYQRLLRLNQRSLHQIQHMQKSLIARLTELAPQVG